MAIWDLSKQSSGVVRREDKNGMYTCSSLKYFRGKSVLAVNSSLTYKEKERWC